MGVCTPTLPLVSQNQKLAYPSPPFVRENQKTANPPHPVVRNHILLHSNLLNIIVICISRKEHFDKFYLYFFIVK